MQRYFFHLHQSGNRLTDHEGQLLHDADKLGRWHGQRPASLWRGILSERQNGLQVVSR